MLNWLDRRKSTTHYSSDTSRNGKKWFVVIFVVALLAVAGFWGWEYYLNSPRPFQPAPVQVPMPPPDPAFPQQQVAAAQAEVRLPEPLQLHDPVKSRQLADLHTDRELLEARLAVKELEQKLDALDGRAQEPANIMQFLPPQAAQLEAPIVVPQVRSIRGLDGNLRAVLSAGGTVRAVAAGERFQRGTVERISLNSIEFRASDGTLHTLSVED